MPASGAIFPGDEEPTTLHLLAIANSELIGCATLIANESNAMQLRGMAVAMDWQRKGVGQRIVSVAKTTASEKDMTLWCNARFPAIGFYERQGWLQSGSVFDVPNIGPHMVMKWTGNAKILTDPFIQG